jgi:hypothetical protein
MIRKHNFVDTPIVDLEEKISDISRYIYYNQEHDRAPMATLAAEQELDMMLIELQRLEDVDQK